MSFILTPSGYFLAPNLDAVKKDKVAPGTYAIQFDSDSKQYYLSPITAFTLPNKVYGKSTQYTDRILTTYKSREKSTAAAFVGLKGSGKTLLARAISIKALEEGIITLVVNSPFCGDAFNNFLQKITQDKIVFFDEIEKVYSEKDDLNQLLTLFDGTFPSHTLYLLTSNTEFYNPTLEYFNNRPGRVYFNIIFKDVDLDAIEEFCQDNLNSKERMPELLSFIKSFKAFNMDMLSVLVTEMNNYPEESLASLSEILNIKPDRDANSVKFQYVLLNKEAEVISDASYYDFNVFYFLKRHLQIVNYEYNEEDEDYEKSIHFSLDSCEVNQDKTTNALTIKDSKTGFILIATPQETTKDKHYNF